MLWTLVNYPDVAIPETQHLTVNGAEFRFFYENEAKLSWMHGTLSERRDVLVFELPDGTSCHCAKFN